MPLSIEEVEHIAELARLDLSEAEKIRYRQQLSAILDYFVQLQELDTSAYPAAGAGYWLQRAGSEQRLAPGRTASRIDFG